ncbi:MAG: FAD-dependent oxidoreductase, partial [Moorella humiferrea]|nr:FAD-dependent oxidoreductase [Moorella humiferrea]
PASVCAALFNSPCQNTCPANVDVPIYIDLIRQRRFAEAYEVIRRENPFPVVCGRVCNHPCEGKCNRAKIDQPLAIRELKRFAADYAMKLNGQRPKPQVAPPNGKKVAVIGAGPAGLTAAYYLAQKGYGVTVFEALPVAGGMMAVGIPEYRLPKKTLQAEIDTILELGVELKTGKALGRDFRLEDLKEQGYEAVFVAIGAHKDQKLCVPGEELAGVYAGATFLRQLNLGQAPELKDKVVAVIGGGNVAMDAARSALRLGAKEVHIIYRRQKDDMPALREEIHEAEKEGVKITCQANPVAILGENGKVTAVKCIRMRMGEFDRSGRRRPVPVEGSEFTMPVDIIIAAIGQTVDPESIPEGLEVSRAGTIVADEKTGATKVSWVFAGGDCVAGPDTVIGAIAAGKKAAAAIDRYLGGDGVIVPEMEIKRQRTAPVIEEKTPRVAAPSLEVTERLSGFAEVELGYDLEAAVAEASRCLRCDVRE